MTERTSSGGARTGIAAAVALVLISLAAVAVWYFRESAWEARITEALAPYAGAPLPTVDAPVDSSLADLGAQIFRKRCAACHQVHGEDKVGPDLAGVTQRRDFAWIRSMMLFPDSMTLEDPTAQALKEEYQVQMMTPDNLTRDHALAVVEFLRRADSAPLP